MSIIDIVIDLTLAVFLSLLRRVQLIFLCLQDDTDGFRKTGSQLRDRHNA